MPQLDPSNYLSEIFWLAITFGAMFLIMWRIAVPKISDVLEARQYRLDDNHAKAEELNREAEEAYDAYEAALAEARSEAHEEVQAMTQRISEEHASKEAAQHEELAAKIAASEQEIDKAISAALANVEGTAVDVGEAAVEKLLGEAVDRAAVETAVKSALAERAA